MYRIVFLSLLLVLFIQPLVVNSVQTIKVLSICSDLEDIIFTYNLARVLEKKGYIVNVEITYLNKNYEEALSDRKVLSDAWYLRKYDEIWIPDLNTKYTVEGSLRIDEIRNIVRVVGEGRILLAGLNTVVENSNGLLLNALGIELRGRPVSINRILHVRIGNKTIGYNATSGYVEIGLKTAEALAYYMELGSPAITMNEYGSGSTVFLAMNPVREAVENNNTAIYNVVALAVLKAMSTIQRVQPPFHEQILYVLAKPYNIVNIILLILLVIGIIELLAYTGVLPYKLTVYLAKPFSKLAGKGEEYDEIRRTIRENPGISFRELREIIGGVKRLKYKLAVLESRGDIRSIKLRKARVFTLLDVHEALLALTVLKGNARRVAEIIRSNPGITLTEICSKTRLDKNTVSRILQRLVIYRLVRLEEKDGEKIVYPTDKLLELLK